MITYANLLKAYEDNRLALNNDILTEYRRITKFLLGMAEEEILNDYTGSDQR